MAGMYNNCKLPHENCSIIDMNANIKIVWWVGNIIAGWTTYGTDKNFPGSSWAWRLPTVIQCVMPGIVMALVLFFPGKLLDIVPSSDDMTLKLT